MLVARGREPVVLLRGESGVGKSRVLLELRFRALTKGWSAYAASCADERDAPLPARLAFAHASACRQRTRTGAGLFGLGVSGAGIFLLTPRPSL